MPHVQPAKVQFDFSCSFLSIQTHRITMGLRSEDLEGHGITSMLPCWKKYFINLEIWHGALSCWKMSSNRNTEGRFFNENILMTPRFEPTIINWGHTSPTCINASPYTYGPPPPWVLGRIRPCWRVFLLPKPEFNNSKFDTSVKITERHLSNDQFRLSLHHFRQNCFLTAREAVNSFFFKTRRVVL